MKKYIKYGLQILIALLFIAPWVMKLTGNPMMVEIFEQLGYPLWFLYFIGAAEVAGALGILFGGYLNKVLPKLAVSGLIIVMIGALYSHVAAGDPLTALIPASVYLLLLMIYFYFLRKSPEA